MAYACGGREERGVEERRGQGRGGEAATRGGARER